jgi:hypothetical protein
MEVIFSSTSSFAKVTLASERKCFHLTKKLVLEKSLDGIKLDFLDHVDNFSELNVIPMLSVKNQLNRKLKNG